MDAELDAWLNWAWTNKSLLMSLNRSEAGEEYIKGRGHSTTDNDAIWKVYNHYTGSTGQAQANNPDLFQFKNEIVALKEELNARVDHQGDPWRNNVTLAYLKALHVDRILHDFFHYRKSENHCSHRIYLHIKDNWRGIAFGKILRLIWPIAGLTNAKVGSPNRAGRADTVVIYCASQQAQTDIVDAIRPYNQRFAGQFDARLTKLVEPVPGLTGVGIATEPPSMILVRTKGEYYSQQEAQSFGFYRASLIFMALERTKFNRPGQSDGDRRDAFKRRAAKFFRKAGIDPDYPARQVAPENLPALDTVADYEARSI